MTQMVQPIVYVIFDAAMYSLCIYVNTDRTVMLNEPYNGVYYTVDEGRFQSMWVIHLNDLIFYIFLGIHFR